MAHVVLALDVGAKVACSDSRVQRPGGSSTITVASVNVVVIPRPADIEALPNPAAPPVPGSPAVDVTAAPAATAAVGTYEFGLR